VNGEFTINWMAHIPPASHFRHNPCEVKVSSSAQNKQCVNVYLILPAGPTRQRAAYVRVLAVSWARDWVVLKEQERTVRRIVDMIPIRLGVNITHVNWWGSKRREVWDAESAAD
jgi:hypothetical protein